MIGNVFVASELRKGMQETLQTWMPSVLAELRRRLEWDDKVAPTPRTWIRLADEDLATLAADQLPIVAIASPGIIDQPMRDADGIYSARWEVRVACVVRGQSFEETSDLVDLYLAAIRVAGAQHRIDVEGVGKARLAAERSWEMETRAGRSMWGGLIVFEIPVADILDDTAGPAVPPEPPVYEDPALETAESVEVTVEEKV